MPKNWKLHDRETVEKAYVMNEEGVSINKIALVLGAARATVGAWLDDPDTHSPFIDEIAIERALKGERKVFDRLSRFENKEFWLRVRRIADREHAGGSVRGADYEIYSTIANGFGMTPLQVRNTAQKTLNRSV